MKFLYEEYPTKSRIEIDREVYDELFSEEKLEIRHTNIVIKEENSDVQTSNAPIE